MSDLQKLGSVYEVSSCICQLIKPMIGHAGCVKVLSSCDGVDVAYFRDAGLLINNLEIKHPVGQYMVSVAQGFRDHYHTSDDVLLYYMHLWIRTYTDLTHLGVASECAMSLMDTVLEECIQQVNTLTIKLTDQWFSKIPQPQTRSADFPTVTTNPQHSHDVISHTALTPYCDLSEGFVTPSLYVNVSENSVDRKSKHLEIKSFFQKDDQMTAEIQPFLQKDNQMAADIHKDDQMTAERQPCCHKHDKMTAQLEDDLAIYGNLFKTTKLKKPIEDRDIIDEKNTKMKTNLSNCVKSGKFSSDEETSGIVSLFSKTSKPNEIEDLKNEEPNQDINDGIEMIHLKMKPLEPQIEDDFNWFFENSEDVGVKQILSNNIVDEANTDETKTVEVDKIIIGQPEATSYCEDSTGDSDIAAEVDTLKQDIIKDIEQVKNCQKRQMLKQSERATQAKLAHTHRRSPDFGWFTDSDDEFNYDFDNIEGKPEHGDKFRTIQITFSENCYSNPKQEERLLPIENAFALMGQEGNVNESKEIESGRNKQVDCEEVLNTENGQSLRSRIELSNNYLSVSNEVKLPSLQPLNIVRTETNKSEQPNIGIPKFNQTRILDLMDLSYLNDLQKMNILLSNLREPGKISNVQGRTYSRHFRTTSEDCSKVTSYPEPDDIVKQDQKSIPDIDKPNHLHLNFDKSKQMEVDNCCHHSTDQQLNISPSSSVKNLGMSKANVFLNDWVCEESGTAPLKTIVNKDDGRHLLEKYQQSGQPGNGGMNMSSPVDNKTSHPGINKLNEMLSSIHKGRNISGSDLLTKKPVHIRSRYFLSLHDITRSKGAICDDVSSENKDISSSYANAKIKLSSSVHGSTLNPSPDSEGEDSLPHPHYQDIVSALETRPEPLKEVPQRCSHGLLDAVVRSPTEANRHKLREMVARLNPGARPDTISVVTDLLQQKIDNQESQVGWFVEVYSCVGAPSSVQMVDGLVVLTSLDNIVTFQQEADNTCRLLMVNGDIKPTYRHKGYKPVNSTNLLSVEQLLQQAIEGKPWLTQVQTVLKQLQINVVLAKGHMSPEFKDMCHQLNIVAMETIPYHYMKKMSDAAKRDMLTYIQLASETNVVDNVTISPMHFDWTDVNIFNQSGRKECEVIISIRNIHLKTIVLREVSPVLSDLRKQEMWRCIHTVDSSLHSDCMTPGRGQTEEACASFCRQSAERLLNDKETSKDESFQDKVLVYNAMKQAFLTYTDSVQNNLQVVMDTESCATIDCVYDDYITKMAAWRTALEAVKVIMKMDTYIVTGLTDVAPHSEREKPVF